MSCGSDLMSGNSEADDREIVEKDPTGRYIRVFLFNSHLRFRLDILIALATGIEQFFFRKTPFLISIFYF